MKEKEREKRCVNSELRAKSFAGRKTLKQSDRLDSRAEEMRKCRQRIDTLVINAYLFRFAAALCSSKSRESSSVVVVLVSMCPPSFKLNSLM